MTPGRCGGVIEECERQTQECLERERDFQRKQARFRLEMQVEAIRLQIEMQLRFNRLLHEAMFTVDRSRADPALDGTASIRV